jgi:hypothetical protein
VGGELEGKEMGKEGDYCAISVYKMIPVKNYSRNGAGE